MKINHDITLTTEELDRLFNIVLPVCMADYTTVEERDLTLSIVKGQFNTELAVYLVKAINIGKQLDAINTSI